MTLRYLISLVLLAFGMTAFSGNAYVELILDASGSMYNRLDDGRFRIVAAKEAMTVFTENLTGEDLHVGLRVYGSKVKPGKPGACEDSTLVVPMKGVDQVGLQKAIANTRALGSTPIALSLERALADFPETFDKGVVVLVTDGKEVCGGDVKAAAEALRKRGIDLQIIGFDLSEADAAAFAGLGTFVNARDARALANALGKAVETVTAPPKPIAKVSLKVPDSVPAGSSFTVMVEGPWEKGDYIRLIPKKEGHALGRWDYIKDGKAGLIAPLDAGSYDLVFESDVRKGVGAKARLNVAAVTYALQARSNVSAGEPLEITWKGPNNAGDYLTIVKVSDPAGHYGEYEYTEKGEVLILHVPVDVNASYEVRYQNEGEDKVLARHVLTIVPSEYRIDAADEVAVGSEIDVSWVGPNGRDDYITLVRKDAADGEYDNYTYTREGNPLRIAVSTEPGTYELRYQSDRVNGVFARKVVVVK